MTSLWHHALQLSTHYGVDPLVFAVLYVAHHPLFWGTMAWLAARVRRKRPVAVPVVLGVFFWFMPYTYLFLFSRNVPPWAYAIVAVVLLIGGTHAVGQIRRRLAAARPPEQ